MIPRINVADRMANLWERLTGSLWFVPAVILVFAVALAIVLIDLSMALDPVVLERYPRLFGATAESSRNLLSTIAGSVVTVAGVTFSVMVVAVSQASSQYTSRILRNFMRDRLSQVTFGVLIGAFVYCVLVLRTVRSDATPFAPAIAVLGAVVIALLAVALLMYFIHHIASTLEAGKILATVSEETLKAIEKTFPPHPRDCGSSPSATELSTTWYGVPALRSGYIQHVDFDGLLAASSDWDTLIRMERGVGEFVAEGTGLVSLASLNVDEDVATCVNDLYVIETYRTVYQDPSFGIRQIVDIALKALSPGVNDSTTAVTAVNYLTTIFVRLARCPMPQRNMLREGRIRLIAKHPSYEELIQEGFSEIRRNASTSLRVLLSLLGALRIVADSTPAPERREALCGELGKLHETIAAAPILASEKAAAVEACERVRAGLMDSCSD